MDVSTSLAHLMVKDLDGDLEILFCFIDWVGVNDSENVGI